MTSILDDEFISIRVSFDTQKKILEECKEILEKSEEKTGFKLTTRGTGMNFPGVGEIFLVTLKTPDKNLSPKKLSKVIEGIKEFSKEAYYDIYYSGFKKESIPKLTPTKSIYKDEKLGKIYNVGYAKLHQFNDNLPDFILKISAPLEKVEALKKEDKNLFEKIFLEKDVKG